MSAKKKGSARNALLVADLYVLDASAMLSHLEQGPGHTQVMALLRAAERGKTQLVISEINLGEVYYTIKKRLGGAAAEEMLLDLSELPVKPVPATWPRVHLAAKLKADGGLSYADCFAATLAVEIGGVLVTGDADFRVYENQIQIEWLEGGG